MRTLGVAVLGLFLGLIAGMVLTSAVARPIVASQGEDLPIGTGLFLGSIMPVLGIMGAVLAVVLEQRSRRS